MQAVQPASMPGMAEAVIQQLQENLKIAEFDGKVEHLERPAELEDDADDDDGGGEEFEFSFPCGEASRSPITAEDAFQNGQIRPIFPFFDPDEATNSSSSVHRRLRKLFVEGSGSVSASTEGRTVEEIKPPAARGLCQKSNSTGSSRLWRFRDLVHRSSSDGKDAFVFLNPATAAGDKRKKKSAKKGPERFQDKPAAKGKKKKKQETAAAATATATAPPLIYGRSRPPAGKRRSYLPYRPAILGFFTSVNVMTKNVHPF